MNSSRPRPPPPPRQTINEALYNHLALPPQLPHRQDGELRLIEHALLDRLLVATRVMRDLPENDCSVEWEAVRCALVACKGLNSGGRVDRTMLLKEMRGMRPNEFLVLHLESQNAALLIRRAHDPVLKECAVFEAFEASPKNESVLAAENALEWDFPGTAVAVPLTTFQNEDFLVNLATFLEQASLEQTKTFAAHTFKAGAAVYEYRNTGDPSIISSLLMAILEENGRRIAPQLLRKRVRDDVCWSRADKPWRRLPYWLVLRVGIERYLSLALGGEQGRVEYKFFICVTLATFLDLIQDGSIGIERVSFLKTKLCRRLVKLDVDKERCQTQALTTRFDYLFDHLGPKLNRSISQSLQLVATSWEHQKTAMTKQIPLLPRKAAESDLRLSLRISEAYLRDVSDKFRSPRSYNSSQPFSNRSLVQAAKEHLNKFAHEYYRLADKETELRQCRSADCLEISRDLSDYVTTALPLYEGNMEQKSGMLLTVMELWKRMDEAVCSLYPLLIDYHPVFYPQMLDILQLAQFSDMARLQAIQIYLDGRVKASSTPRRTIFEDPSPGCFGDRYFQESAGSSACSHLHDLIVDHATSLRAAKEQEWKKKSEQYEDLTKQIDTSSCVYFINERDPLGPGWHDAKTCPRCVMMAKAQSLRICIYEHPLPSDPVATRAVIFELACPQEFAAYRDMTWLIYWQLASPYQTEGIKPKCLLHEYGQLKTFVRHAPCSLTLASTTKSFLFTHYSGVPFPVEWEVGIKEGVCRPNGLKFSYFDQRTMAWPGRMHHRPTFAHHAQLELPKSSPFARLLESKSFSTDTYGRSSYEIMASQSMCPTGLNVHEFLAFQNLFSGKARRWLTMLNELGSTNLNFSNEATMLLVTYLAHQCGPAHQDGDPLRQIHAIFRNDTFCQKLIQQLSERVENLSANWRETQMMDTVITLLLRIHELTSAAGRETSSLKARTLLVRAREICRRWVEMLRNETYKTRHVETARRCQQYALWAALLCKRTYVAHLNQFVTLDSVSLQTYIECSITVQDNLVVKVESLPKVLQHAVIFDLKLSYRLRQLVCQSIVAIPDAFRQAVRAGWPEAADCPRQLSALKVDHTEWISCTILGNTYSREQKVHYNFVEGLLLVDLRPLRKLPKDPTQSVTLNELFGDQALLAFPSELYGMQYVLCINPNNYRIHVGFDGGEMIVRAEKGPQHYLQLVPRERFRSGNYWDLPGPLLDKCFHWLDLNSGKVNIVQPPHTWQIGLHNWVLDINQRICSRYSDTLIDTYSPLFYRIARIFDGFEEKRHIVVIQPAKKHLSVEIQRLQLFFFVNKLKLLQSPQLRSEVDPNQDAGTWYGLASKLVCREVDNSLHRSILLPFGEIQGERSGCHVVTRIIPNGIYGKYTINSTLGRIDCATESLLLYMKAHIHACTSFVLPDPLTGRTGTEEALHWLASSICQPWTTIRSGAIGKLVQLAELTPRRDYYPADMKVMKTDRWSEVWTETMQHPAFRPLVNQILQLSEKLAVFNAQEVTLDVLPTPGDVHLHQRGLARRQIYERAVSDAMELPEPEAEKYESRDRSSISNIRHRNVLEAVHILRAWPDQMGTTKRLAQVLSQANSIGGFSDAYDKASLSDRLNIDIRQHWGSLVKFAQDSSSPYSLMFLFAPMSFKLNADMSLIRTLSAFAIFEELRTMPLPKWDTFELFQPDQYPQLDYLVQLITPFRTSPPKDDRDELGEFASAKQLRKMRDERSAFEAKSEEDCRFFAKFLLSQWPCLEPNADNLSKSLFLDVGAALEIVRPEWKRLYKNVELSAHLSEVQGMLNRRHSETKYETPQFVTSEDIYPVRVRGREIPLLRRDLMKRTVPHADHDSYTSEALHDITNEASRSNVPLAWERSHHSGLPSSTHQSTQALAQCPNPANFSSSLSLRHASRPADTKTYGMDRPKLSLGDLGIRQQAVVSHNVTPQVAQETIELGSIVSRLSASRSAVRQRYGQDLQQSLEAFATVQPRLQLQNGNIKPRRRDARLSGAEVNLHFASILASIERPDLSLSAQRIQWLQAGQLWPIITTVTLLEQLRSTASTIPFGKRMKESLIQFGVAITLMQRDMRLNECILRNNVGRYQEEEANSGHSNWQPMEHPDWLLLEIESNLLIRSDQVDVALATISPASGANSVLQMNMGQGKTSCIIPMVSLTLANRDNLVRVVVPKALILQTAQLLQARLGGLLGRQVRHVPFSRRTPTQEDNIRAFHTIHKDIRREAGVMLCQPEHNLSFMLSGLQRLLDKKVSEAGPMIKVHQWLKSICRDILDESDYTLAVRTQLIYPSGSQMTVDGHPHRWVVAEAVLKLVDRHLYALCHAFPHSIEVVRRVNGGFPLVYFLRSDVEDELIRRITADVSKGNDGILPMGSLERLDRVAIKDFLTVGKLRSTTLQRIRQLSPDRPRVRQTVYLLRGLLVNRILMMTLKKRWNVQYGLHPQRDPIAVPYHAKGVPSEQSEWGHPDVAILFTCLAFYYDGINISQLQQSLEHVLKSDDPSTEYDKWTQSTHEFPETLRVWNSINVDDDVQLHEIWRAVRYNVVVIDYFLNNFVFPRHAKQFKVKLQSNGWDIPLFTVSKTEGGAKGKASNPLTTGFSGTNDNKTMLPLNIKQEDLPGLSHTNAEVLTYLLHDRSRECVKVIDRFGKRASEEGLLWELRNRKIRVLIDAGAQILEMDNVTLAQKWLAIDRRAAAALYFDESNMPWIITQLGRKTPFLASPYAEDLSNCLVYLDEAHTRGTDLKLHTYARGALTLGLGQSKDHTVQAAMRLRQLGTTQSVTFFVPPEVYQSIVDLQGKTIHNKIDSSDVISWLLDNTCDGLEQLQPLYYSQGIDFCRRMQAVVDNQSFLTDSDQREAYVSAIKQDEQQSLQQLYEPKAKGKSSGLDEGADPKLKAFVKELNTQRKGFQDTGKAVHGSALQEVEQEREVAFEVESVRQVKKPYQYPALCFPGLHPDIETFARTSRLPADSHAFCHAFKSLSKTGVGKKFGVSSRFTESKFFVSTEFDRTVKLNCDLANDNFMRPVNWILWSELTQTAMVIIPEEAERILLILQEPTQHYAYLLTYAAPITRKMLHFGDLNYFSIPHLPEDWKAPDWLKIELGIYAGRLYFGWSEYTALCQFLGIDKTCPALEDVEDSSILEDNDGEPGEIEKKTNELKSFTARPLTFLQEWLAVRRRGQDFVHSPMGFMTQCKSLQETHPFFRKADNEQRDTLFAPVVSKHENDEGKVVDEFMGVDDMGANVVADSDASEDEIEYNESELGSDED